MYKKKRGAIEVKPVSVCGYLLECRCAKTGRSITIQFKYKMKAGMQQFFKDRIAANHKITIFCTPHPESGWYNFSSISRGQHLGIKQSHVKKMAMSNLMREVEKDYNPVKGKSNQQLLTGRAGLPTSNRLSGKIGMSLIKNIHRPEVEELKLLARKAPERRRELASIRSRRLSAEKKYIEYCLENSLAEDDKSWEKFLRWYESKGILQENFIERVESDEPKSIATKAEQARFEALLKEAGL